MIVKDRVQRNTPFSGLYIYPMQWPELRYYCISSKIVELVSSAAARREPIVTRQRIPASHLYTTLARLRSKN